MASQHFIPRRTDMILMCVSLLLTWSCSVGLSQSQQEGGTDWYYKHWCGDPGGLPFVDDAGCKKRFPSSFNRDAACPATHADALPGYTSEVDFGDIMVDQTALQGLAGVDEVNIAVVLVRRTPAGVLYRYLGNGKENEPAETWSSSKIFAMADAADALEDPATCAAKVGLTASAQGKHGSTPMGDLATVIASYDETAGYTSNSCAKYFATIGGKQRLGALVTKWLGADLSQSLGGSYGEAVPADLGWTFARHPNASEGLPAAQCTIAPDASPFVPNHISALTAVELLRRLVLHRDVAPARRFPNLLWSDVQEILYGAESSQLFPGLRWGGMSADPGIFVQSGLDMDAIEARSGGTWRIFSKLGDGWSLSRAVGEVLTNAYACLPLRGGGGVEFLVSARASVANDTDTSQADLKLQRAVSSVVEAIVDGRIEGEQRIYT